MATNPAAASLTEIHRVAQAQIGAQTVQQMLAAWPLLDPSDIDATTERWLTVARAIVTAQRATSSALAAQYLRLFRALELGTTGAFSPSIASRPDLEALTTSLLVTGPVKVKQGITVGSLSRAIDVAAATSSAAGMRHALNGGRDTIRVTGSADQRLLGYQRVSSGRPCAFCAMLVSRGPVYSKDTGGFRCHDGCHCTDEPVYSSDAPVTSQAAQYRNVWNDSTGGLTGDAAVNAFRRAFQAAA